VEPEKLIEESKVNEEELKKQEEELKQQ